MAISPDAQIVVELSGLVRQTLRMAIRPERIPAHGLHWAPTRAEYCFLAGDVSRGAIVQKLDAVAKMPTVSPEADTIE